MNDDLDSKLEKMAAHRPPAGGKIAAALAKAQRAFKPVQKSRIAEVPTKSGGKYSYRYANLADIMDAIRDALAANELAITQCVEGANLVTWLLHSSGERLFSSVPLVQAQGTGPQALGSSLTYSRRYGLCALLGVEADEDDDGNAAELSRRESRGNENDVFLRKIESVKFKQTSKENRLYEELDMTDDQLLRLREELEWRSTKDVKTGCWNWPISRKDRYPRIKSMVGSRLSYIVFKGPFPAELNILHRCDNPNCINPDHLFSGTQSDNVQDMISKGRQPESMGSSPYRQPNKDRKIPSQADYARAHPNWENEPCTEAQRKKLFAMAKKAGYDEVSLKSAIGTLFGKDSTKELTKGQIQALFTELEAPQGSGAEQPH